MSLPDNAPNGQPAGATAGTTPSLALAPRPATGIVRPVTPPAALASPPSALTLLRSLRRRWVLATCLGVALGVAAAAGVWFFLPPAKNTANVQLTLNPGNEGTLHHHPDHIENFDSYQNKQVFLIKSRLVLNTALRQPGIAQLETFRSVPDPLEWLEHEVRVDFPAREILRITVSGEDVDDLKAIVNAVTKAYLTEIVEKQTKDRQTRLDELKRILGKYRDRLASNRSVKQALANQTGAGDSKTLGGMMIIVQDELRSVRAQLTATREQIRVMEATAAVSGSHANRQVPDKMIAAIVEQKPSILGRQANLVRLEEQLEEGLKRSRDPNLPGLRHLKEQIESERMLLAAERSRTRPQVESRMRDDLAQQTEFDSATLEANLARARALEKCLQDDVAKYCKLIAEAPNGQLKFQEIDFDIENNQNEVTTAQQAINQLEVEMNDPPRVRPLQEAVSYKVDNVLRRSQAAGAAGVGVFGLTVLGIALVEFRSRRVSTVDEVTQGLGVRVVGTVPACPRRIRNGLVTGGKLSYWKSMLAESVDAARTLLLHHARSEDLRIIMVTSASGGEGKTSLTSHLAVSMARSGRKTLLIDCDLRNPSAHRLFNVPLEPGLSSVLRGEIPVEAALHPTQAAGLWLMPAGACDGQAVSMLAQDGMQPVFDRLRREFDFLLVDSSPVLPVADALMVAQQADGVLFAILREVSRLPKVHEAYQKLASLGVRMLGAVVNGTSGEVYGYGYGYGSSSRYVAPAPGRDRTATGNDREDVS
jgi:capsular exopolysaccharide synthesis family protein